MSITSLQSPPNIPSTTIASPAPARSPAKKRRLQLPATPTVSSDLGTYIARDVKLLKRLGWKKFVQQQRRRGDFADLADLPHPAKRLLQHYKSHGAPVKVTTKPWSKHKLRTAIERGPHQSCHDHIEFLEEEFIDMINKQQWVVLPYKVAKELKDLRSP